MIEKSKKTELKTDHKTGSAILETGSRSHEAPAVLAAANDAAVDPVDHPENETETDAYNIYTNNIYVYVDEFINTEYTGIDTDELKQDKAFFPRLVNYIYDNYIGDLLRNKMSYRINKIKPIYNIKTLDALFDIYMDLVYKYKFNNRPLIVEYSLFTGINRDYIYDWNKGLYNNYLDKESIDDTTISVSDIVSKWIMACERALIDGNDTIKDIFILKAKHGYRDNNNDIQITVNHKNIISAETLPELLELDPKK